jgi:hypothetical protein
MRKDTMIYKTQHGDNIADQIQTEDAYGFYNVMNEADLYNIIDQFQSHILEESPAKQDLLIMISLWMQELEQKYEIELL